MSECRVSECSIIRVRVLPRDDLHNDRLDAAGLRRRGRRGSAGGAHPPLLNRVADLVRRADGRLSRRDRRQQLIEDFHLTAFINRLGFQLSGGERRRCEVARALASGANGPTYLLLDEPFAGVDPLAVADLQQLIEGLRSRGMGILITDHNVRETLATTDRAYILNDGAVLAAGRSEEVAADPQVRRYYLGEGFQL